MVYTLAQLDRAVYNVIRLKLVELGYLPDVTSFTNAGLYQQALKNISDSSTPLIQVVGVGSSLSRAELPQNRIVINRDSITIGEIGGNVTYYEQSTDTTTGYNVFTKKFLDVNTESVNYGIHIFCETTTVQRVILKVLRSTLGTANKLNIYETPDTIIPENSFYLFKNSEITSPIQEFFEMKIGYVTEDVFIVNEDNIIAENVPLMTSISPVVTQVLPPPVTYPVITDNINSANVYNTGTVNEPIWNLSYFNYSTNHTLDFPLDPNAIQYLAHFTSMNLFVGTEITWNGICYQMFLNHYLNPSSLYGFRIQFATLDRCSIYYYSGGATTVFFPFGFVTKQDEFKIVIDEGYIIKLYIRNTLIYTSPFGFKQPAFFGAQIFESFGHSLFNIRIKQPYINNNLPYYNMPTSGGNLRPSIETPIFDYTSTIDSYPINSTQQSDTEGAIIKNFNCNQIGFKYAVVFNGDNMFGTKHVLSSNIEVITLAFYQDMKQGITIFSSTQIYIWKASSNPVIVNLTNTLAIGDVLYFERTSNSWDYYHYNESIGHVLLASRSILYNGELYIKINSNKSLDKNNIIISKHYLKLPQELIHKVHIKPKDGSKFYNVNFYDTQIFRFDVLNIMNNIPIITTILISNEEGLTLDINTIEYESKVPNGPLSILKITFNSNSTGYVSIPLY